MTVGLIGRLRALTVDYALLKSGESVLNVGCGTGGVTIPAKLRVGKTGSATGITCNGYITGQTINIDGGAYMS